VGLVGDADHEKAKPIRSVRCKADVTGQDEMGDPRKDLALWRALFN